MAQTPLTNRDPDGPSIVACRASDAAGAGETIAHVANCAARTHPGADLVLLLEDFEPPGGWLERLSSCAAAESTTATVTALPGGALEGEDQRDELADAEPVALPGEAHAPRVDLVCGPCVYVTRAAFRLLDGFDESLPTSASVVADFGMRARGIGLANVVTDDLLLPPRGEACLDADDHTELLRRHPALCAAIQQPPSAAVERSLAVARAALRKLSVTVDARSLGPNAGGTQVYALELIRALARTREVRTRVLVGPHQGLVKQLDTMALDDTSVITYEQALGKVEPTDIVHRPQQVFTVDDLDLLRPLGHRLVITHMDLIAYHNPTYFAELEHWRRHVRATRIALAAADQVLFFSSHALRDAEREALINPQHASIVPIGVDPDGSEDPEITRPEPLANRDEPFMLCLGSDYAHKNRPFALELTAELRRAHAWSGVLVFAGSHVEHGSSALGELRVLERRPELEGAVIDLGPISDSERRWLMAHTRALVYPSVLEGFGLVPFEAAIAGVPCLFASQSSLAELLPAELATLSGWDIEQAGARANELLVDESARERHVEAARRVASEFRWQSCGQQTVAAYRRAINSTARESARVAWEALSREAEIVRLDQAVSDMSQEHGALLEDIGADGLALVGPHGLLSPADRRALLALAARPALGRPLFAAGRVGYRLAHRGKGPG